MISTRLASTEVAGTTRQPTDNMSGKNRRTVIVQVVVKPGKLIGYRPALTNTNSQEALPLRRRPNVLFVYTAFVSRSYILCG